MRYVNNGKSFYGGSKTPSGKYYPKNVKYFVAKYDGFGISIDLFQDKVLNGERVGIDFIVKSDLKDFRRGKTVCERGTYRISLEDIEKNGKRDVLNPDYGEQMFVPMFACEKVA